MFEGTVATPEFRSRPSLLSGKSSAVCMGCLRSNSIPPRLHRNASWGLFVVEKADVLTWKRRFASKDFQNGVLYFYFFAGKSSVAVRSRVREIGLGGAPRKLHFSAPIPPMMTGRYYKKNQEERSRENVTFCAEIFLQDGWSAKMAPGSPFVLVRLFFCFSSFSGEGLLEWGER